MPTKSRFENHESERVPDEPLPAAEPSESDDWDDAEIDRTDNEQDWEAFLADDDECDPLPEEGDFWIDPED